MNYPLRPMDTDRKRKMPEVEKGIPLPPPAAVRKKHRKDREYRPSPWIIFLKNLAVGDSFVTYFSEHKTVQMHLSNLGMRFEFRWFKWNTVPACPHSHGRFWITHQPNSPEYSFLGLDI